MYMYIVEIHFSSERGQPINNAKNDLSQRVCYLKAPDIQTENGVVQDIPVYQVEMICLALLCICIGNSAHVD